MGLFIPHEPDDDHHERIGHPGEYSLQMIAVCGPSGIRRGVCPKQAGNGHDNGVRLY